MFIYLGNDQMNATVEQGPNALSPTDTGSPVKRFTINSNVQTTIKISGVGNCSYSIEILNYYKTGYVFQKDNVNENGYLGPLSGINYLSLYSARSSSDTGSARPFAQMRPIYLDGTIGESSVIASSAKTNNCTYPYYIPLNCTEGIYAYQIQVHTFSSTTSSPNCQVPSRQQQITAICTALESCNGNGELINGVCQCYSAWEGVDCRLPICANGATRQGNVCVCAAGYYGTNCYEAPTKNNGTKRGMAFIVDSVGFDDNAFNSSINAIVNYVNLFEMNNLQIMLIDNTNVIIKNPAFSTYTNLTFLNAISEIYGRRTRTRPLQLDSVFSTILQGADVLKSSYNYIFYVTQTGGVLTNSSVLGKLRGSTHMFEISCIGISAPSKTLPENVIVDLNMIGETQTADNWYSAMTEMMAVSLTTDYPPPSAPPQPACTNIQASIWIAADLSVGVSDYRTQMQSILQLFPTAFSTSFDISAPGQGCSNKKNISNVYEGYSRISGWSYYAGQYGENDPTFCVSNLGTVIYSVGMDGGGKPNYDTGSRNLLKLFNATLSNNCLCSRYEEQETRKIVIWMPIYSYISDSYEQFFNYPYEHYVVPFGYELKDGDFYYGLSTNNGKFDGALPRDVLGSAANVVNYLWEAICGS
ncbi:hypothetical protein RB195_021733 [Necator americanus]